jgi:hypothetical protein
MQNSLPVSLPNRRMLKQWSTILKRFFDSTMTWQHHKKQIWRLPKRQVYVTQRLLQNNKKVEVKIRRLLRRSPGEKYFPTDQLGGFERRPQSAKVGFMQGMNANLPLLITLHFVAHRRGASKQGMNANLPLLIFCCTSQRRFQARGTPRELFQSLTGISIRPQLWSRCMHPIQSTE